MPMQTVKDNLINVSGLVRQQVPDNWPEYKVAEFNTKVATTANPGNVWSTNQGSSYLLTGRAAQPGLLSFNVNPALQNRRIYGYIWGRPLAALATNPVFVLGQFNFYRGGQSIVKLPLSYFPGMLPQTLVSTNSFISMVNTGGIAEENTITANLYNPMGAGSVDPEPVAIIMQPLDINVPCDRVDFDLLTFDNTALASNGLFEFRVLMVHYGY